MALVMEKSLGTKTAKVRMAQLFEEAKLEASEWFKKISSYKFKAREPSKMIWEDGDEFAILTNQKNLIIFHDDKTLGYYINCSSANNIFDSVLKNEVMAKTGALALEFDNDSESYYIRLAAANMAKKLRKIFAVVA